MVTNKLALALLGCALMLTASPALGAKDDEPASIFWQHDWLPTRLFDYRHKGWKTVNEGELKALFINHRETVRYERDGARVVRWEFELAVRDPAWVPEFFHIASKSPETSTTFTEFDVSWVSGGKTTVYSEDDLVEHAYDANSRYISARTGRYIALDRRRPGTLKGTVAVRDEPARGFEALMAGREQIQGPLPCKSRTLTVQVPTGTRLAFETRFFKLPEPSPVVVDGYDTYTWEFETLWQPNWEPAMPHWFDSYPVLWWSNLATWEQLGGLLDAVWEPGLVANEAMTAWAEELTQAADTPRDKAQAIHDAVADGWDYLGFYPGESGFIPHAATHCWAARIGDCKDKTALMVTLMRAVGLDAHPALVTQGTPFVLPSTPQNAFNHAIVYVDDGSGGLFLDSVDAGIGSFPVGPSVAGRQALIVDGARGGLVHIPETPPERWLVEDETVLQVHPDGSADATVRWRWVGAAANERAYEAARTEPARWERTLRARLLRAFPQATIVSLDDGPDPESPRGAWSLRATLQVPAALSMQGPHALLVPPWLQERDPADINVDPGRRTHPEVLDPLHTRSRVRVRLPDGMRVLALPSGGGEERERWSSALSAAQEGDEVVIDLAVQEHPGPMEKGLQEARRNFVHAIGRLQAQALVLQVQR